jgi:hypothetical protein
VLLKKFFNVGFAHIAVAERRSFGLSDVARYPLFTSDFIDFLRRLMPPERHAELVQSIVVAARKPMAEGVGSGPAKP